jgi:hypothetical protein
MALIVKLKNPSQVTTDLASTPSGNTLSLNRSVYQRLSSLIKNKTLLEDYNSGNLPVEFKDFLDQIETVNTGTATSTTLVLNEYLGSLGVDSVYPYSKDVNDIADWLDINRVESFRLLKDSLGNLLVTPDNELLVAYYR